MGRACTEVAFSVETREKGQQVGSLERAVAQESGKPLVAAAWQQSRPSAPGSAKTSSFTLFSTKIFSCISALPSPPLSAISSLLHLLLLMKNA